MDIDWDEKMYKLPPKTNEITYFPSKKKQLQEKKLAYETKVINSQHSNIIPSFITNGDMIDDSENSDRLPLHPLSGDLYNNDMHSSYISKDCITLQT